MAKANPRTKWVIRRTYDTPSKQWQDLLYNANLDDGYEREGKDKYGNTYMDHDIDFAHDWRRIEHLASTLPNEEFERFSEAAHDNDSNDPHHRLLVDAQKAMSLGAVTAKRHEMEASQINDPEERARRMRIAGATATASHAYGSALKRHGHVPRQEAERVARLNKILGGVRGMIGQEPGANTRMATLTPLLVGYLRNATPEQMAKVEADTNEGNLNNVLKDIGQHADNWRHQENMKQYPFAAAANRWNSPSYAQDLRAMMGTDNPVPQEQQAQMNAQQGFSQPQGQVGGPLGPGYNASVPFPNTQPQVGQATQQPFSQPGTGWAAPIQQMQQQAQGPDARPQAPGDYSQTMGSMGTQTGLNQVMPGIPTEPGQPPVFPTKGELLAAPSPQAAKAAAFLKFADACTFWEQQEAQGLIAPEFALKARQEALRELNNLNDYVNQQDGQGAFKKATPPPEPAGVDSKILGGGTYSSPHVSLKWVPDEAFAAIGNMTPQQKVEHVLGYLRNASEAVLAMGRSPEVEKIAKLAETQMPLYIKIIDDILKQLGMPLNSDNWDSSKVWAMLNEPKNIAMKNKLNIATENLEIYIVNHQLYMASKGRKTKGDILKSPEGRGLRLILGLRENPTPY
jgi:hypothetical protein